MLAVGGDVFGHVLSFLDAKSLSASARVSKSWRGSAENDKLWTPLCRELWTGKGYIPAFLKACPVAKEAYAKTTLVGLPALVPLAALPTSV